MKKLLTATTALALVGGAAFAEITISGDAKLGVDYNSEPGAMMSKHSFEHEMGVDFSGSGTTDGGLNFGGSAGFDTGDDKVNTGTVFVSGAFGTITIGGNDAADLLAGGIADVGLNGLGVDDVVEDLRGGSAAQFRYDQSVGSMTLALSAGTSPAEGAPNTFGANGETGRFEVKKNSYAIGVSFSASGARLGIGYDSRKAFSAGFGYSTGQISANAFWAKRDQPYMHLGSDAGPGGAGSTADGTLFAGYSGLGVDVSYTVGASTLTMVYSKTDLSNIQPVMFDTGVFHRFGRDATFKGRGVGFSHDLGGGASLVAGFGKVPLKAVGDVDMADIGQLLATRNRVNLSAGKNVASVGLSFTF